MIQAPKNDSDEIYCWKWFGQKNAWVNMLKYIVICIYWSAEDWSTLSRLGHQSCDPGLQGLHWFTKGMAWLKGLVDSRRDDLILRELRMHDLMLAEEHGWNSNTFSKKKTSWHSKASAWHHFLTSSFNPWIGSRKVRNHLYNVHPHGRWMVKSIPRCSMVLEYFDTFTPCSCPRDM